MGAAVVISGGKVSGKLEVYPLVDSLGQGYVTMEVILMTYQMDMSSLRYLHWYILFL